MRVRVFIALATVLGVGVGYASWKTLAADSTAATAAQGARISFAELEHDFGEVIQGETVEHTFEFKNTGTAELEVISAQGS